MVLVLLAASVGNYYNGTFSGTHLGDGSQLTGITSNGLDFRTWQIATNFHVGTNIFHANQNGCYCDSNLYTGGGHDDTTAIQALLNKGLGKPIEVILDGPCLISGTLFLTNNNVYFHGLNRGCGLFVAAQCGLANILMTGWPFVQVTNSMVACMTINGNGLNQTESKSWEWGLGCDQWVCGLWFTGGDNLVLSDLELRDTVSYSGSGYRGFGIVLWATGRTLIDRVDFYRNDYGGDDFLHFWGGNAGNSGNIGVGVTRLQNSTCNHSFVDAGQGDDVISCNYNESTYECSTNTFPWLTPWVNGMPVASSLEIVNFKDFSTTRNAVINFHIDGTGPGNFSTYCLTNLFVDGLWSQFSRISMNIDNGPEVDGAVLSADLRNVHNTSIAFMHRAVGRLNIAGFVCDAPYVSGMTAVAWPQVANPFVNMPSGPFYPTIRFADRQTNVTISGISGYFNYGYTNPIVAQAAAFNLPATGLPKVSIANSAITGNSPVYADLLLNGTFSGVVPQGTVTFSGVIADSDLVVASNAPAVVVGAYYPGATTNQCVGATTFYITNGQVTAVGTDPDLASYLSRANVTNATAITAFNVFVTGLKWDAIWPTLFGLWPLYGVNHTQTAQNLITNAYNIVWYGDLLVTDSRHTALGVTNAVAGGYGDTLFVPSTAGVTVNDYHLMVWNQTTAGMGTGHPDDGTEAILMGFQRYVLGTYGALLAQSGNVIATYGPFDQNRLAVGYTTNTVTPYYCKGFIYAQADATANHESALFGSGGMAFNVSYTHNSVADISAYLFGSHKYDGSSTSLIGQDYTQLSGASVGHSLSAANMLKYYQRWLALQTALGRVP